MYCFVLFFRFLDPIFFGDYPRAMREILQSNLPTFTAEEKKLLLRYKVDFIGLNHYTAIYAKDCIHSPCNLQTYEGNAFVLATGERDGVKIGRDVRTSTWHIRTIIISAVLHCSYTVLLVYTCFVTVHIR
jgi:beta-glucosidase